MDIAEIVSHYLNELRKGDSENAFFSLIEADRSAIPYLQKAARQETDPEIKATLVEIIWQHRATETIPFLAELLTDPHDEVWKAALEGLVTICCPESITVLENALVNPDTILNRREWIEEALDQAIER
jgi:HEAT repeat protein